MKKYLIQFLLVLLIGFNSNLSAKADSIILSNGEVIKGRIQYILSGMIQVKSKHSMKRLTRVSSVGQARDIVEVGVIWKKKYLGEIRYLDEDFLEIITPSGIQKIDRIWIREITLSQGMFDNQL